MFGINIHSERFLEIARVFIIEYIKLKRQPFYAAWHTSDTCECDQIKVDIDGFAQKSLFNSYSNFPAHQVSKLHQSSGSVALSRWMWVVVSSLQALSHFMFSSSSCLCTTHMIKLFYTIFFISCFKNHFFCHCLFVSIDVGGLFSPSGCYCTSVWFNEPPMMADPRHLYLTLTTWANKSAHKI